MDTNEDKIISLYRALDDAKRRQALDYLLFLAGERREERTGSGSCHLEKRDVRPEAAKEPLFTE